MLLLTVAPWPALSQADFSKLVRPAVAGSPPPATQAGTGTLFGGCRGPRGTGDLVKPHPDPSRPQVPAGAEPRTLQTEGDVTSEEGHREPALLAVETEEGSWRCRAWGPVVVRSPSRVRLFATPRTAARQASLSITNPQSLLKPISIESVMPSNHLILSCPLLLLPPTPPSIRVFSSDLAPHIKRPE